MDFVREWSTIEVHMGRILCRTLGHHRGSDLEDFVRDIGAPWRFRLRGFCGGHWGTIEVQIGKIFCGQFGHHGGSDWEDFVRDIGAP